MAFTPQAGDAVSYLELGQACAAGWARCWDPLRPVGSILFFSMPYRLGLVPATIIVVNWLLIVGSIAWMSWVTSRWSSGPAWLRWPRLAAITAGHLLFLWAPAWNSLSDLPAALFALAAVQCLLLSATRERWWLHLTCGLLLGLAVSLRAFYLYPALITVGALLLQAIRRPRVLLHRAAALVLLLPIGLQFAETHRRTHLFGFIYPPVEQLGRRIHLETTLAGYDTSLTGAVRYDAKDCFHKSRNFKDAVEKRDLRALACLLKRRHAFYFGSYTTAGAVYIARPAERYQGTTWLILESIVLVVALARLGLRRRRPGSLIAGVFLLMVYAQSMLIVPEGRFMYVVLVWMWCDLLAAGVGLLAPGRLAQSWRTVVRRSG